MNNEIEDQLLYHARNGILEEVKQLLDRRKVDEMRFNINCKGRSKSNLGWTPLHLACYFGHKHVVEELLKAGVDVNVANDVGDTPLHRAAFTGRKELVMLLLQCDADAAVINGDGQTAQAVTQDAEIRCMLEAAGATQQRKLEELLLTAAREGNTAEIAALLNRPSPASVNCTDMLGNTPLHCAAYRGQKLCALKLLKCGADCNIRNNNNQTALDLAQRTEIKHILGGKPSKGPYKVVQRFEAPLFKRSRFFGLNMHWVVLERGVLSWFQNQSDAQADLHRQGCKHLTQAVCTVKTTDKSVFSVKYFDDSIHIFKVHPKNEPEKTRQKWLQAIEEHSAYSTHYCSQDQFADDDDEDLVPVGILQDSFQMVHVCQQKLEKEVSALLTMVEDSTVAKGLPLPLLYKVQEVTKASKETSAALSNCLTFFTKQEGVRNLRLEQEQEKTKILSEALQTLACEHHELEQSLVKGSPPQSLLSDDEFYDALSDSDSVDSLSGFETVTSHSAEDEPVNCSDNERPNMSEEGNHDSKQLQANGIKKYSVTNSVHSPSDLITSQAFDAV